jgi:LacI family transcriptional regulator
MGNRFPARKRVTIRDVAAAAGVSPGTASKYLSGGDYYVSAEVRSRIDRAMRELDYQPNEVARSLVNKRTFTIGVVVASLRNPFYPELVGGIEEIADPAGYTLLLGSTEADPAREAQIVQSMLQRQVDGVVMASVRIQADEVEKLISRGLQVVLASRDLPGLLADTVVVDNHAGGHLAGTHLVAHGHRRIALLAGPRDIRPFVDREAGFREALAAADLTLDEDLVARVESNIEAGRTAMSALLRTGQPPTAVFVSSDELALGALDAAAEHGVDVPTDLAMIGFDNVAFSARTRVPLTTVDSHAHQLGALAAERLTQRIADPGEHRPMKHVLHPRLVVRDSCGCREEQG